MQLLKALKGLLDLVQAAEFGTGWLIAGVILIIFRIVLNGNESTDND